MRAREVLFGTLGVVSTSFGVAVLAIPDQVRSVGMFDRFLDTVASADPTGLMLAAGFLVGGYATLVARSRPAPETVSTRSEAERRFETAGSTPPETVTANRQTVTAREIQADIDAAVEGRDTSLEEIRQRLRSVATDVYASATGEPRAVARTAVEDGTWTTDRAAATFLSSQTGPTPSVRSRLTLWLRPNEERQRRIEQTIAAIEELES